MKNGVAKVIPSHIQIETVAGYCTVRCVMCPIEKSLRKEIMSTDMYEKILNKLLPIRDHVKLFSILGLGEPLLDKELVKKVELTKKYGFKGVGIYSNGTNLSREISGKLIDARLDTIIFSIDGAASETQAAIRVGSDLKKIVANVEGFITERTVRKANTKIIVRFTKQERNQNEWDHFFEFWTQRLSGSYGDAVFCYNVHNTGNSMQNDIVKWAKNIKSKEIVRCNEVYDRLIVFSDGKVGLCCGDQFGHYKIGNVLEDDPIALYNSPVFVKYRKEMDAGNIMNLELCKSCTVMYSIMNRKHMAA